MLYSSPCFQDIYSDVTLACDGRFFQVHKLVLSVCSEYFEEILGRTTCSKPVIILKDIRHTDLQALLNYMYAGEASVPQNDLARLIKAAECLKIKGLAVPDESPPPREKKRAADYSPNELHNFIKRRAGATNSSPDKPVASEVITRLGGIEEVALVKRAATVHHGINASSNSMTITPNTRVPVHLLDGSAGPQDINASTAVLHQQHIVSPAPPTQLSTQSNQEVHYQEPHRQMREEEVCTVSEEVLASHAIPEV